jgi:hypothetical protein
MIYPIVAPNLPHEVMVVTYSVLGMPGPNSLKESGAWHVLHVYIKLLPICLILLYCSEASATAAYIP